MRILQQKQLHGDYSAKNMAKPVHFYCQAPNARAVFLVGDFNEWDASSIAMQRRLDGWWFIEVNLTHGHHKYRFVVDGEPMLDPRATGTTRNGEGEEVSVVAVS
jgi:1,4-alpha-glucan branching enzyme